MIKGDDMKNFNILLICMILILLFISSSCTAGTEASTTATATEKATSMTSQSKYNDLVDEIARLKQKNTELVQKMDSLNATIDNLEQNLYQATEGSPLLSNYYIDSLLQEFFMKNTANTNHTIDMFPGMLKSIRVETSDERILFIFTIDRMEMNPDWNGPGTDVFLNKEEKFIEYKGGLDTVFEYKGFDSYETKQAAVLQEYADGGMYEFFMIDDEIVFVGPDPGP
jgi:hypothetical protein